jgi:uncharacterized protein (DUF1810 family)
MKHADDPYDLGRFVAAQEHTYEAALEELRNGRKTSHWMWFVFPQLAALGTSAMAVRYAISGLDEAAAYLGHPVLDPRLTTCCRTLLAVEGRSAVEILGEPDDLKLRSSMTLFALVPGAPVEMRQVMERFFGGEPDRKTLGLLDRAGRRGSSGLNPR